MLHQTLLSQIDSEDIFAFYESPPKTTVQDIKNPAEEDLSECNQMQIEEENSTLLPQILPLSASQGRQPSKRHNFPKFLCELITSINNSIKELAQKEKNANRKLNWMNLMNQSIKNSKSLGTIKKFLDTDVSHKSNRDSQENDRRVEEAQREYRMVYQEQITKKEAQEMKLWLQDKLLESNLVAHAKKREEKKDRRKNIADEQRKRDFFSYVQAFEGNLKGGLVLESLRKKK